MSRAEEPPPAVAAIGRFLQICVYAPIGAGAKLVDDAPGAVAQVRQELSNARFIGRMVVSQAEARLRDRLGTEPAPTSPPDLGDAPDLGDEVPPTVAADGHDRPDRPDRDDGDTDPSEELDALAVDALAVPDYDDLPAIDIIAQLESLDADELERIDAYERSHRRRRTVLGKIDQLRASL